MINRLKCAIGKHAYYEIKRFSDFGRKVGCKHCDKTWAMNDLIGAFVPWDEELDAMYELLDRITEMRADK